MLDFRFLSRNDYFLTKFMNGAVTQYLLLIKASPIISTRTRIILEVPAGIMSSYKSTLHELYILIGFNAFLVNNFPTFKSIRAYQLLNKSKPISPSK